MRPDRRLLPLLLALLASCFVAPAARAGGISDSEYAKLRSQLADLVDAQRYAAADSLLKPWWARVVPDSAKHPGPAGRIIRWQATIYADSWYDSARLPGSWTPAQSYDWLVVASRHLLRAYGNDSAERMEELRIRADIARDREWYRLADSLGRERVALARRIRPESPKRVAVALIGLASSQSRAGEYLESNACLDSAIAIHQGLEHPDTSDLATALNGRASNSLMLRADDAAERDLLAALDLRERTHGPQYERAQIVGNLAIIAYRRGDAAKAAELYTRSYELYRTNDPPQWKGAGWMLSGLASSDGLAGRLADAVRHQREGIAILEREWGKEHRLVARQYLQYAIALREKGDAEGAYEALEHGLGIIDRHGGESPSFVIQYAVERAQVLMARGNPAAAESVLVVSIARSDSLFGPNASWRSNMCATLATARIALGDSAGARAARQERYDLEVARSGPASARSVEYAYDLAQYPDATGAPSLERAQRALEGFERLGELGTMNLPWARQLVARALHVRGRSTEGFALALEAERGFRAQFDLAARGFTAHEAIEMERDRPRPLGVAWRGWRAARPSDRARFTRELWDEVVRSRARVFDELATRHRVLALADDSSRVALEELQRASTALSKLVLAAGSDTTRAARERLRAARERQAQAERALALASESFRTDASGARAGLADVERGLGPRGALVAFARFGPGKPGEEEEYAAFVRTPSGAVLGFALGRADAVDSLVARWRADLTPSAARRRAGAWRVSGAALRRRVWDPIAPALAGADEVWLVPDGALASVPWLALPVGANGTLLDAPFLLRRVESERDLISAVSPARGSGLLALGGAEFSRAAEAPTARDTTAAAGSEVACGALRGPFAPLPGTLAEIADVAAHWREAAPSEDALELSGAGASEREFRARAPGRRVLHVATHAFSFDGACEPGRAPSGSGRTRGIGGLATTAPAGVARPASKPASRYFIAVPSFGAQALLGTGLLFTGAEHAATRPADDDGVLGSEEIAALDLRGVQLAVLSACDTGLGEQLAGEGTLGLERAFRVAGVGATLASLWPVDDQASRAWMRAFYERDGASGASGTAARAAREAARAVRAMPGRAHPFWWAAFQVTGAPR